MAPAHVVFSMHTFYKLFEDPSDNIPLYINRTFSLSIHSPMGHTPVIPYPGYWNSAAMDTGVQISFQHTDFNSRRYISNSEIAASYGSEETVSERLDNPFKRICSTGKSSL